MHAHRFLAFALAAGALGLAASSGCSPAASAAGGAGGSGGTTTSSGSGGAGGSGGTTSSTTTTSSAAGGSGGSGGAPCVGLFKFSQPKCEACLEAGCCSELVTCHADPSCIDCVTTGDAKACDKAKVASKALEDCNTTKCHADCTPPPPPVDCKAPLDLAKVPSGGKCIAIDKQLVACNPVTQEGCNAANGDACDVQTSGGQTGFQCYKAQNTATLCADCDATNGPFCAPGLTCDGGACARFCCADTDCSPGATCVKSLKPTYDVGVCQTAAGKPDGGV
jgi:hypothetical protein